MTNNTMTNPNFPHSQSDIERVVMRRVRVIRVLRPFISAGALAVLTFTIALWGIGREVWVARVFENAPHNLTPHPSFYLTAFTHTNLCVLALAPASSGPLVFHTRATARLAGSVLSSV